MSQLGFKANRYDLTEDLGQVEYLFCDAPAFLSTNKVSVHSLINWNGDVYKPGQDSVVKADHQTNQGPKEG
jgi:hypothetical protein